MQPNGFGFGAGTDTGAGYGDDWLNNFFASDANLPGYGGGSYYAGAAAPGAFQAYDQPIGPSAGYDYAIGPDQGTGGGGGNDIQSYIDEYGL